MSTNTTEFAALRNAMIDCQLRPFNVTDHAVLARMGAVARELYLCGIPATLAYSDRAVEVEAGGVRRRLLPPMVLGRMLQEAQILSSNRVLDVGGGAGYSAAVLAGLAEHVVALEQTEKLSAESRETLAAGKVTNVQCVAGDLAKGHPAGAPYDVIFINGMIDIEPEVLLAQLAPGGRLIAIARTAGNAGRAVRFEKSGESVGRRDLFDVTAAPMPGFAAEPVFSF